MKQSDNNSQSEDYSEILKQEIGKTTANINERFDKLANKLRGKADKAKEKLNDTKKEVKRVVLLRRFELYADAANHLEEFSAPRREGVETSSD